MKKGVCHAHVAATLLILVALAGFFLALFYNPQKYLMEVKDEVIEDNFCNGTCNHTVVLTTNNALSIGDNFCANGGCPYATTVSFPSFNIKSIGNNYCANGCYAMRTFYSKTVTSIGDSFCNWGCDQMSGVHLFGTQMSPVSVGSGFCVNGCNSTTDIRMFYAETIGSDFCRNSCNATTSIDMSGVKFVGADFCTNGCWALNTIIVNQDTDLAVLGFATLDTNIVCADVVSYTACGVLANPLFTCVAAY